jgi:hypothetical protein
MGSSVFGRDVLYGELHPRRCQPKGIRFLQKPLGAFLDIPAITRKLLLKISAKRIILPNRIGRSYSPPIFQCSRKFIRELLDVATVQQPHHAFTNRPEIGVGGFGSVAQGGISHCTQRNDYRYDRRAWPS